MEMGEVEVASFVRSIFYGHGFAVLAQKELDQEARSLSGPSRCMSVSVKLILYCIAFTPAKSSFPNYATVTAQDQPGGGLVLEIATIVRTAHQQNEASLRQFPKLPGLGGLMLPLRIQQ
jgi:hypothetical protein